MLGATTTSSWVLCRTKPRREEYAAENIERRGCTAYLPRMYERTPRGPVIKIMFPSYLFVAAGDQWSFLLSTYGVSAIVMSFGNTGPMPVPERVINYLKSMEGPDGIVPISRSRWKIGQALVIKRGPLQGRPVSFMCNSGARRVAVLLELLGRKVSTIVDEENLGVV
jgi:transcription antitermination factor NusG